MYKRKLSLEQALQKARHYCAYQQRCHAEVKEKLHGFGLHKNEFEQVLSQLIEENYLNEERFAVLFAGGKFRANSWGKRKIEFALKQKKVSTYNIKKAINNIDIIDYEKALLKLSAAKWASLKHEQYLNRIAKTKSYLIQKGYEPALINKTISLLGNKESF